MVVQELGPCCGCLVSWHVTQSGQKQEEAFFSFGKIIWAHPSRTGSHSNIWICCISAWASFWCQSNISFWAGIGFWLVLLATFRRAVRPPRSERFLCLGSEPNKGVSSLEMLGYQHEREITTVIVRKVKGSLACECQEGFVVIHEEGSFLPLLGKKSRTDVSVT
jgi:hypothetical protein